MPGDEESKSVSDSWEREVVLVASTPSAGLFSDLTEVLLVGLLAK